MLLNQLEKIQHTFSVWTFQWKFFYTEINGFPIHISVGHDKSGVNYKVQIQSVKGLLCNQ